MTRKKRSAAPAMNVGPFKPEVVGPRVLTIDRRRWLRGKGGVDSALLTKDGLMCCLGFYARACGLSENDIRYNGNPAEVFDENELLPSWLFASKSTRSVISEDTSRLMSINDSPKGYSSEGREARIASIFAKHGVRVRFVNGGN